MTNQQAQEPEEQPVKSAPSPNDESPSERPPTEDGQAKDGKLSLAKRAIPRVVSVLMLIVVLLMFGMLFFEVMRTFITPLFLAGVLAVIFEPLHKWFLKKLPGKPQTAAIATTLSIVLIVLVPMAWLSVQAVAEIGEIIGGDEAALSLLDESDGANREVSLTPADVAPSETIDSDEMTEAEAEAEAKPRGGFLYAIDKACDWIEGWLQENLSLNVDLKKHAMSSWRQLGGAALQGFAAVVGFIVGSCVMLFSLFYFLVDGPRMLVALMHLSPMDDDYERELLEKFAEVSRAVVLATLLSAVAQGLLAGIGYYFALPSGSPVFLLTVATMLLSIVPFVGATAIWAPVSAIVFFYVGEYGPDGEFVHTGFWPGILLALYGAGIVSTVDNLIKPWVLHGQSNLHPLLALLSVLGGVSVLGPIGILVGPMLVAFLQALLNMLRKELDSWAEEDTIEMAATAGVPVGLLGEAAETKPESQGQKPQNTKQTAKKKRRGK